MIATASTRVRDSSPDVVLRRAAVVFVVALVVHAADHLRRGFDVITPEVRWAGNAQLAMATVAVVLVFARHRSAALWAIVVGFASAIGFAGAHVLPHWSAFSDSFTGSKVAPGVTWFSWFAALFEIGADTLFGIAGLRVLRARRMAAT